MKHFRASIYNGYGIMIKRGSSRIVIFIAGYAFKFPYFLRYENFLHGLIANMNERKFWKCKEMRKYLCPVRFFLPFGFLIVMPKCRTLSDEEFNQEELKKFCDREAYKIPAEIKQDSFGYLNGRLVAVDYG